MSSRAARSRRPDPAIADLLLIGIAAIWGMTFPLVKNAVADFPPVAFLAIRFVFASLILIPVRLRAPRGGPFLEPAAIVPGICLAGAYALQTQGLRTVSASVSAFITGTSVILVPVLGVALRWERVGPRVWSAAALSVVGIYLLQGKLPGRWTVGETMTAGCAFVFALQILLLGRAASRRDTSILSLGAGQIFVATLVLVIASAAFGDFHDVSRMVPRIRPATWFAAIFTGLLATALAFMVQTWAQRRVPAGHVAVCFATEPLFAAFFSIAFYGDRLAPAGWFGAGFVLLATVLVTTERAGAAGRAVAPRNASAPGNPGSD